MEMTQTAANNRSQVDYELVCRAREQGDETAFADLMKRYQESIYVMMLRMTGNATEADDLTMVTFSKAFGAIDSYSPTNTFSTWLFAIATRSCIDFIRKRRVQLLSLDGFKDGTDEERYELPIPSDEETPEESIIREQRYAILRSVVNELKPHYKRLVTMRYFEDKSYEDIAKELNMPLGTVKTRLHRAHGLLHALMQRHNEI